MDLTGQPSPRTAPWLLTRWILLALVLAGIVAMHVLSQPEPAGGHDMLMQPQSAASMPLSMTDQHHAIEAVAAMNSGGPAIFGTAGVGMSGSMLCCILFLAAGALLILLMLLASIRRADVVGSARPGLLLWAVLRRGPPGGRSPRISLCVLLV
ncbi:MAG: hypothetical protein ACR2P2_04730 [Nakamurella sp.]